MQINLTKRELALIKSRLTRYKTTSVEHNVNAKTAVRKIDRVLNGTKKTTKKKAA